MPERRRFPLPWTVEQRAENFIIRDANGLALAYFYFDDEPQRRAATDRLTRDEARRIGGQFLQAAAPILTRNAPLIQINMSALQLPMV